ncbi:T-box transcription factor T-like [Rhinatrema bivittatum]|uniref:T-box transcription factor T-like n=1 Tax=Rhinatrema bivittatum TaxID=194408 RepID=UPI001126130A|nr:T-box transcription factor T-like [Rhinatrema bivittatum]
MILSSNFSPRRQTVGHGGEVLEQHARVVQPQAHSHGGRGRLGSITKTGRKARVNIKVVLAGFPELVLGRKPKAATGADERMGRGNCPERMGEEKGTLRSDHKDMMDEVDQQSAYSQLGSWLIPGTGSLCPPTPHPQFGAPLPLSSPHSCDRYSSLRNHRSAPYPNPYSNRNNSPTSYSDNSSACLSMLQTHDNWSSLQVPTHSSMLPMSHNSGTPTNSSQYPSLWSVSNSTITPVSQAGAMSNGLGTQFLRGSAAHYPSLPHSLPTPSSGSPLYDSGTPDISDSQYDASVHTRLLSTWTPVTPPSM